MDGISDLFVTVQGVLQLNYTGMSEIPGGETVEQLEVMVLTSHSNPASPFWIL